MADLEPGRFARALQLSRLGARVAWTQGRAALSRDPAQAHRELAAALTDELGKLKGLPMKIGQLLSYMEGVVPDEHRDTYQQALATLRTAAAPLGLDLCQPAIEQQLGAPLSELFERFDPEPIAAASLGQVYRASYRGREVAVKVQYPGIAEATTGDLASLDRIVQLMRVILPKLDTRALVEDFRERLLEECDYRAEAEHQRRFSELLRDDPDLLVPEVVPERSADKVLTTQFVAGVPLSTFLTDTSPQERDRAGLALFRLAFGMLLRHGQMHADPHPGNLLFRVGPEHRLAVLDFGCVQPLDPTNRRALIELLRAELRGDDLRPYLRAGLGLAALDPTSEQLVIELTHHLLRPVTAPQPYRFDRDYAKEVARRVVDAKARLAPRMLTGQARLEVERSGTMMVVRNLFGLASVWGELASQADFRAVIEPMLVDPV